MVDFMYLGEVSVRHEDLPNFMAVAKQLKVNTPCAIGLNTNTHLSYI